MEPFQLSTLGRSVQLGDFYDVTSDVIIGMILFAETCASMVILLSLTYICWNSNYGMG